MTARTRFMPCLLLATSYIWPHVSAISLIGFVSTLRCYTPCAPLLVLCGKRRGALSKLLVCRLGRLLLAGCFSALVVSALIGALLALLLAEGLLGQHVLATPAQVLAPVALDLRP